jgi:outer membrane protein assembly factor BamB
MNHQIMEMNMFKSGIYTIILAVLAVAANAADWPQYGGPNRNNVSSETVAADAWKGGSLSVLWETEVNQGYSGAAIKAGKAYFIDRENERSQVLCLDMESGKKLWQVSIDDPGVLKGTKFEGTRGTPTVTDDAVYVMTGYGALACIDQKSKKIKWQKNLVEEKGLELHQWGYAQAPCLYKNLVIVSIETKDANVFAFDRETGRQVWASPRFGTHGYVSPQVVSLCGMEMVVAVASSPEPPRSRRRRSEDQTPESPKPEKELEKGYVVGLDPADGSMLWKYHGWKCKMVIPHPLALPGNRLFLTAGYGAGSAMIQLSKSGSEFAVKELFKTDEVGSQLNQPILFDGHLFINSTANGRKDGLSVCTLDGELLWRTKDIDEAPIFERGPMIMADGKLIILDPKSGDLHLIKADPGKYEPLASAPIVKGGEMSWAPTAISDGLLLVRDWDTLKCVDLR